LTLQWCFTVERSKQSNFYMNETRSDPNKPIVTYGLTLVNVLVFGIMVLCGVSDELIQWGGNYGPAILSNQWWRLLTCMFLHGGILHILCNGYALFHLGAVVERMLGRPFFIVIYFVSGIMGSLASLWWNPMIVSVGASGAVFGIFGALLTFVFLYRQFMAQEAVAALRKNAIIVLGLNLILGYSIEAIDMAAHLGGFLGGVIAAALLCRLPRPMSLKTQRLRMAWVIAVALAVTIGVCVTLPKSIVTWGRTRNAFVQAEQDVRAAFKQIATAAESKELSNQEFVERFETQVLHRWRQARERFDSADIGKLPARAQRHYNALSQYVKITDEYWETYYNYMRATEEQQAEDYERKLAEIRKKREAQAF
jgi:rhomboid protease GluP